jgi:hypothetical protein
MEQAELFLCDAYKELGKAADCLHENQNWENSAKVADICKQIADMRRNIVEQMNRLEIIASL